MSADPNAYRGDEVTWPYQTELVERTLDPFAIERLGREILARGAAHGRLVAFLGAGTSMAYGRLSWPDLVQYVLDSIHSLLPDGTPDLDPEVLADHLVKQHGATKGAGLAQLTRYLGTLIHALRLVGSNPEGADPKKTRPHDPLLILQLCSDVLDSARQAGVQIGGNQDPAVPLGHGTSAGGDREEPQLGRLFRECLATPHKHDELLFKSWATFGQNLAKIVGRRRRSKVRHWIAAHAAQRSGNNSARDLPQRRYGLYHLSANFKFDADAEANLRTTSRHSNAIHSPIAQLVHEFGIRRFATTNYDHEIDRALDAAMHQVMETGDGLAPPRSESLVNMRCEVICLTDESTASAIAFAVEGRRRHSAVLQLHGSVDSVESMIMSEHDYQRRYLAPSKRRDLLDHAIRSLFGANPLLYVGSSLTEDDVLRPLREFMSVEPRRRDRLGVALMPAGDPAYRLAMDKVDCLVRYGVHVIHYGYEEDAGTRREAGAGKGEESWLCRFKRRVKWVEDVLDLRANKEGMGEAGKASFEELCRKNVPIKAPAMMEGQPTLPADPELDARAMRVAHAIDIGLECELLEALAGDVAADGGHISPDVSKSIRRLLGEITSSVVSAFLCARLVCEQRYRLKWIATLARPLQPVSLLEAGNSRMKVLSCMPFDFNGHGAVAQRFVAPGATAQQLAGSGLDAASLPTDERWKELALRLQNFPDFTHARNRRTILLPMPRGAGKGSMFDALASGASKVGVTGDLKVLLEALMPEGADNYDRIGLVNFAYLSDVSHVADLLIRLIDPLPMASPALPRNLFAELTQALDRRLRSAPGKRILLVLANVGVLFDRAGDAKNGQVRRFLHLLLNDRFERAPLDFVIFCDEALVPLEFRQNPAGARPGSTVGWPSRLLHQGRHEDAPPDLGAAAYSSRTWEYATRNRLRLLGIQPTSEHSHRRHVFVPQPRPAAELARWFFELSREAGASPEDPMVTALERLGRITHDHRFAVTLTLAYCSERWQRARISRQLRGQSTGAGSAPAIPTQPGNADQVMLADMLTQTIDAIETRSYEGMPECVVHEILDAWQVLHLRTEDAMLDQDVKGILLHQEWLQAHWARPWPGPSVEVPQALKGLYDSLWKGPEGAKSLWALTTELLWQLAVISHPVEYAVLSRCPGVRDLVLGRLRECARGASVPDPNVVDVAVLVGPVVRGVLELCVRRCLAMRQAARSPSGEREGRWRVMGPPPPEARYVMHRALQQHFIRQIGGRDIEAMEWDQFATSMYASQPDETPALSLAAHQKITGLIRTLSRYDEPLAGKNASPEDMQCLRAAYFVARNIYSVGVLSHIALRAPAAQDGTPPPLGHMEEYRRLVRWITHRAHAWRDGKTGTETGYFHAGELVWLYTECGVVSIAQGKLEDAMTALQLAEGAAAHIESDDTGSIRIRIGLHMALAHLERGKPRAAKRMLEVIAARQDGHEVPPLIAKFYLGTIEHLGGEYHAAGQHYDQALEGFRKLGRTRAIAFVLRAQADLLAAYDSAKLQEALRLAQEAISVAQRGGHEDVRMLAILTWVRLRTNDKAQRQETDSYRLLEQVQQYARDMGMPRLGAILHEVRATLLLSLGETTLSAREAVTAAETAALYDLKLYKAKALLTLARVYKQRRELKQCRDLIRIGLETANACEYFACVRGFRQLEGTLDADPGGLLDSPNYPTA